MRSTGDGKNCVATIESIVEAFARGLARGLVEQVPSAQPQRAKQRRRTNTVAGAPPPPPTDTGMIHNNGTVAPPVTQAELDRIEAILKGEMPSDSYMPGEGVPVTGPNG